MKYQQEIIEMIQKHERVNKSITELKPLIEGAFLRFFELSQAQGAFTEAFSALVNQMRDDALKGPDVAKKTRGKKKKTDAKS